MGAGERVATDGVATSDGSWADTSAITGESIPVEFGPGDTVPAGSVNSSDTLRLKASAAGGDNRLIAAVGHAQPSVTPAPSVWRWEALPLTS